MHIGIREDLNECIEFANLEAGSKVPVILDSCKNLQTFHLTYRNKIQGCKVETIFNDISNSDNCCYNDRFENPRFFLYLSHVIHFHNNEYKKSLSSVIMTTWSEKMERNVIRFCMRKRSQTFRLPVPSSQA